MGEENKDEYILRYVSNLTITNGNLAVFENNRILILDTLGKLKCKFGGYTQSLDNTGKNNSAIISDELGNYIVTTGDYNQGLKLFSPKGEFKKVVIGGGKNFSKGESVFKAIKIRTYNNEFYLLDGSNRNIKKFDKYWNFIGIIVKSNVNEFSKSNSNETLIQNYGEGKLWSPRDFVMDSKGNFFIADNGSTIKKYDANGEYIKTFTLSQESKIAPLIAIDYEDNIYAIVDRKSPSCLFYLITVDGTIVKTFENEISKYTVNSSYGISSIALDKSNIYLSHGSSISVLSKQNLKFVRTIKSKVAEGKIILNKPRSIVCDLDGDLIVKVEKNLKYEYKIINGPDFSTFKAMDFKIKNEPFYDYSFSDLSVCPNGNFILTDSKNKNIQIFDGGGNFIKEFKTDIVIDNPRRTLCLDSSIIVIEKLPQKNTQILTFNHNGALVNKIDQFKSNSKLYANIVETDFKGNLYFSEGASINVINSQGKFLAEIGGYGVEIRNDLQFGIVEENGQILLKVGDYKSKVTHFDSIVKFKIYKNRIFIADMNKIVITDLKGSVLGFLAGKHGSKIGEFDFITDFDIHENKLFVTDMFNNRIISYSINF